MAPAKYAVNASNFGLPLASVPDVVTSIPALFSWYSPNRKPEVEFGSTKQTVLPFACFSEVIDEPALVMASE